MKSSLKSFLLVLVICAVASFALATFGGRSLAALINLGSYVGAVSLLLGAWRQFSSNDALDQAQDMQHFQNLNAVRSGQDVPHKQLIAPLSSGPLFFAGLVWLVLLHTVRYGLGINL
jgi:glycerol uptake facilitator-like aquaporin